MFILVFPHLKLTDVAIFRDFEKVKPLPFNILPCSMSRAAGSRSLHRHHRFNLPLKRDLI